MPTNHRISSVMVKTSAFVRTTATLVDPCTGALGATSHRTSVAAVLSGHQSATGARSTGDPGLLPTDRPGPASLQCRPSSWTHEGYRGREATDSIRYAWQCRFPQPLRGHDRPILPLPRISNTVGG